MLDDILSLDKETLLPPDSRVSKISGVRDRIQELREGDSTRSRNRAMVQELIDGLSPYDQEKMDRAGRGDDANINFREAEGDVAAATTPYYELFFGVPRAANIELYYGDNKQKNFEWSEKLSQRYSDTLWGWKGYKYNVQLSNYQKVVHGRGPIMWDSKRGWHFISKRDDSVWVSDNAMCDLDLLEEMVIAGHYDPVQLYKKISKDVSEKSGWNVKLAKHAIIKAAPHSLKDSYHHAWTQYEASLRRGDCIWGNKAARIYYKIHLMKEFDGKITQSIVLDTTPDQEDGYEGEDDFLFQKVGMYESFHQIINPFFFDVGPDGMWYSVKGLGPKIFDFRDLSNRFMCTLINGAMASCGISLQAKTGQAMEKIQQTPIVRASGINFIPPDWEALQTQMRAQLDGPMSVKQLLNNTLEGNVGQYRQRVDETPAPTLGQQQLEVTAQTTLTRGAYDRDYHHQDDMHQEILRRMLDPNISEKDAGGEEAIAMRKKLIEEDNVPEEALKFENVCSVKAVRNVGYGSPQNQQVVADRLAQLMGTMDAEGRQNLLRMIGGNLVGQSQVDRFWKKFEDLGVPSGQAQKAEMENIMFGLPGSKIDVIPEDNPMVHLQTHFGDLTNRVQQLSSGQGDPASLITRLDNAGPHDHQHLEAIKGDPTLKNEYKRLTKVQMSLGKITDQLKKQVEKAQKSNQKAQPKVDPKMMEGLLKVMLEAKTKETKMKLDEARKDKKMEFDVARKDKTTAHDMILKRFETMNHA
jgi:hypothetical protein